MTLIIARPAESEGRYQAFAEDLVDRLRRTSSVPVLVVPHLYYLQPDGEAVRRLRECEELRVVAAWLYPRATRWTLKAFGAGDPEHITALDLRNFDSPDEAAEALLGAAGAQAAEAASELLPVEIMDGNPESRWYPVLDYSRCRNCRQCLDFCIFGAYSLDEEGRVRVTRPDNCKPGCPACARVCPTRAIMFPEHPGEPWMAGSDEAAADRPPPAEQASNAASPARASDELDHLVDILDEMDDA